MYQRSPDQARKLLEDNIDLIEQVVRRIAWRNRLPPDEAEELKSIAFVRLVENDYAVIRKFRSESTLRAFLTSVIRRLLLDLRAQKWGKWRPSRAAQRLGLAAMRIEEFVSKDGRSQTEAAELLQRNHNVRLSAAQVERLTAQLPHRTTQAQQRRDAAQHLQNDYPPDAALLESECESHRAAIDRRVNRAIAALPREDRRILRLRYCQGLKISHIAKKLGLEQRPLYGRINKTLQVLRKRLQDEGITHAPIF
ncbi:MAG: sigma-70 family RNA polymerase sigma factor [Thermoanaerobaculia bacterium]|nr:sigma-70 family RNA polymerase sigma factor [Thermoanaerobaculia bacterium]